MKAIIEGKRYNTETATEIASNSASTSRGDFRWFAESLYRTPRGNWFLAGAGGPMTRYARRVGNGHTSGSGIIRLSDDEARSWLEAAGLVSIIEKHFDVEDA